MSIDYSKVKGLSDHIGNIVKITDASGRVIWAASGKVILEVEKITDDTYVNDTVWYNDNFILLDIYPESANSVVKVTYGGLTKTLQFEGINAQQVYFGTYGGVSDSVTTPASGELTIEGDLIGFTCGAYKADDAENKKYTNEYCPCITDVIEWGSITSITNNAFKGNDNITFTSLPNGIISIGSSAFEECHNVQITNFPEGLISIGDRAFYFDESRSFKMRNAKITLPSTLQSLYDTSFYTYVRDSNDSLTKVSYLSEITMLATTPPALTRSSGIYMIAAKIIVPKGCGEAYRTAEGWSGMNGTIEEAS